MSAARFLTPRPRALKRMRVLVLPGDGIGPEISAATVDVLNLVDRRLSLALRLEPHEVGLARLSRDGTTLPQAVLAVARAADGIVLGPLSNLDYPPRDRGGINISAELRTTLDLYANIRPARSRQGLPHYGRTPIDLVIMRE